MSDDSNLMILDSLKDSAISFIQEHPAETLELAQQGISQLVNGIVSLTNKYNENITRQYEIDSQNSMRQYELEAAKYIAALDSATQIELKKLESREKIIERHSDQVDKIVDSIAVAKDPILIASLNVILITLRGDLKTQLSIDNPPAKPNFFERLKQKKSKNKNDDDVIKM